MAGGGAIEGNDLVAMICKAVQEDPEEVAQQQGLLDAWCQPPTKPGARIRVRNRVRVVRRTLR